MKVTRSKNDDNFTVGRKSKNKKMCYLRNFKIKKTKKKNKLNHDGMSASS